MSFVSFDSAPRPMIQVDLLAWLTQAQAGDVLEYHRGFVSLDRLRCSSRLSEQERLRLEGLARMVMQLVDRDLVHPLQRRIGSGRFSYLAVARVRSKKMSAKLALLMTEVAQ
jgi:hypothetical protein